MIGELDMNHCEFCDLTENDKKYLLYENDYWQVFLADNQNYIGRCIIICREHIASIDALHNDAWLSLKSIINMLESVITKLFGAVNFNFTCLMNNAFKCEEPQPHMHFHLIPRYNTAVHISDHVYFDKEFGHHYSNAKVQICADDFDALYKMLLTAIDY